MHPRRQLHDIFTSKNVARIYVLISQSKSNRIFGRHLVRDLRSSDFIGGFWAFGLRLQSSFSERFWIDMVSQIDLMSGVPWVFPGVMHRARQAGVHPPHSCIWVGR